MNNNNGLYLNTLDADGKPPEHRLSDAWQAEQVYQRLWNGYNYGRGVVNSKVQGAINGNAPVSQAKLDSEGLGWMSNVNFRLLESDVNAAQIPFYMIFADVPQYATIKIYNPKWTALQNNLYSQIISEEHTKLNQKWKYFDYYMQLSISNMVKYGSGPIYFPDKKDFRFKSAPSGTVFVPDETTQNLDEMAIMFIYYEWELTDLFRHIDNPKAEEAGWNVENCKTALTQACNEFSGFTRSKSWEYWQQKLREEDVYWSQVVPKIRTAWGFTKEFSGKISRFLIVANTTAAHGKYLYCKYDEYDNWSQIVHPFFCEIGNGNWNGVKGIGIKAYNFRDAQNKLKNRVLDAAFLGSQILIQAPDAKTAEDLQLMQMGPMAILPQGVNFNQMPLLSTIDKPMAVDRAMEMDLKNNIGGIRQNAIDAQTNQPISATEANINATYTGQITQAEQTLWLRQCDGMYEEQVNRLKEKVRTPTEGNPLCDWEILVKEFHEALCERGVPADALKYVKSVKATRSIGRGSEYFKVQQSQQIYGILRNDPNVPQGVIVQHLRNTISALGSREYLEMIWPENQLADSPTEDASKAQDENAGMILGVPPVWTAEQNNLIHAQWHLQFAVPEVQGVQQGKINPADYLKYAQVALDHIQKHLQELHTSQKDPIYQQLFNQFQQIQSATQQISQQYQAQQEAQQQAQAEQQQKLQLAQQTGQLLDPESQIKLARVKADAQIESMATQAAIDNKKAKTQADIHAKAVKTSQELGINDVTTAQQLRINRSKKNGQTQKD